MEEIDLSERDLYLIRTALKGHLHKLLRTFENGTKTDGVRRAAHEKSVEVSRLLERIPE